MNNNPILIIEDEEALREGLSDILKEKGYSVDTADNGLAAINILKSKNYKVVLLDLKMPHIRGYEILKHIKTDTPSTRVIVMTGTPINLESLKEECTPQPDIAEEDCKILKLADDLLVKPFSVEKLLSLIAVFCS